MEVDSTTEIREEQNQQRLRLRAQKRFLSGLNSSVAILLLLALVLMVNYISSRHYWRTDVSRDDYYKLSDKTVSLLQSLSERVHITVFIQPGHEVYQYVFDDVINLLREYEYASGNRIHVERIDPDRNLARAEDVISRFDLEGPNVVVFEYGDRRKVVTAEELMEMDYRPMMRGQLPEKTAFHGEQVFSSAILSITQVKRPRVYFLQGFGERNFDDRDEYVGLSTMGREIRRDDIELIPFSFGRENKLPEDADAIIIAGPSRTYASGALDRISTFVKRSGRFLLLLNSETDAGFGPLLRDLGVDSVDNLIIDPTRTMSGFDLLISDYGSHPITEGLSDITSIFYWPRALPLYIGQDRNERSADKPNAVGIAFSSASAWAELDPEQRPYRYDAERDIKGPLPVAVAVERGSVDSVAMDIQSLRVVIFGDVDFISNSGLSGGNGDLFMNSLNWILERDELMALSAKPVKSIKLMMTQHQLNMLFVVVVLGVPTVTTLAGVFMWWRRRH